MQTLTAELAEQFAEIALGHVGREYPNKLDQVLTGPRDLATPHQLHPVFYGSFDWHSAVHSHWLLARCLRRFPGLPSADRIRAWFDQAFETPKVEGELAFLSRPASAGFERPYGWAWMVKLQAELESLQTEEGRGWAEKLSPLAWAFEARFLTWLPKATYPTRVGAHGSTAFALVIAQAYARYAAGPAFGEAISVATRRWFEPDRAARPFEPSGADFLSPTLMEAEAMRCAMPADEFGRWFDRFLPGLADGEPASLFTPAIVSDRTDGQIAHLDGLNLSRAWCWRRLAAAAPPALQPRLEAAAEAHLAAALPHLADHYMGEHWLASFAMLALDD